MTCCIRSYSAASDSSRKKCSRVEATKNNIDQTRINFSNSINISYFNLSKRWIERARRFFSLFYDNLIYFFFIFAWYCLFTRSKFFYGTKESWLRFLFDFDLLHRAFSFGEKKNKVSRKTVRCWMDDSIKHFQEDEIVPNSIREWIYGVSFLL